MTFWGKGIFRRIMRTSPQAALVSAGECLSPVFLLSSRACDSREQPVPGDSRCADPPEPERFTFETRTARPPGRAEKRVFSSKRQALERAARPKVSGKTALFPRNDRPYGLKCEAFQTEIALWFETRGVSNWNGSGASGFRAGYEKNKECGMQLLQKAKAAG